jgi:hypothetical protein
MERTIWFVSLQCKNTTLNCIYYFQRILGFLGELLSTSFYCAPTAIGDIQFYYLRRNCLQRGLLSTGVHCNKNFYFSPIGTQSFKWCSVDRAWCPFAFTMSIVYAGLGVVVACWLWPELCAVLGDFALSALKEIFRLLSGRRGQVDRFSDTASPELKVVSSSSYFFFRSYIASSFLYKPWKIPISCCANDSYKSWFSKITKLLITQTQLVGSSLTPFRAHRAVWTIYLTWNECITDKKQVTYAIFSGPRTLAISTVPW